MTEALFFFLFFSFLHRLIINGRSVPGLQLTGLRGDLTAATLTGAAVINAASAGIRVLCVCACDLSCLLVSVFYEALRGSWRRTADGSLPPVWCNYTRSS